MAVAFAEIVTFKPYGEECLVFTEGIVPPSGKACVSVMDFSDGQNIIERLLQRKVSTCRRMDFHGIVKNVFSNWTALQIAVENQLGGPESKSIAEWMVGVTDDFFKQSENLEGWEVGDYLAEIISNEFRTELEDGSPDEIGSILCKFYGMLKESKMEELENELRKLPKCNLALCRLQETPDADEDGEEEPESLPLENLNIGETSDPRRSNEPVVDEEGFTLVRKNKRK